MGIDQTGATGGLTEAEIGRARRLGWGFAGLVVATAGLIVLGALVRAHEAGLACPDWPLCFGQVIPRFDLKIAFEVGHRWYAGLVSLAFLGLSIGVLRTPGLRARLGGWVAAAGVVLGIQVMLGALTVWELLASWTVTSHLLTGNTFAVLLLFLALGLRSLAAPRPARPAAGGLRILVAASGILLVLQMALGGLVSSSYAGMACPDWPTCQGTTWFPSLRGTVGLHLLHRWNGPILLAVLFGAAFAARGTPGLRGLLAAAALVGVCQVLVGIANVVLGIPVEVTGIHSALATLLVLLVAASLRLAFGFALAPRARRDTRSTATHPDEFDAAAASL